MAASLLWRGKVVHSVAIFLFFTFGIYTVHAQSATQKALSFSYKSTDLKTVVEALAKASGLHVIYSPDKTDMSMPVSLVVSNKTIEEVLDMLEKSTHLSLKIQDRHIIIKSVRPGSAALAGPEKKLTQADTQTAPVSTIQADSATANFFGASLRENKNEEWIPLTSHRYVSSHLVDIQSLFDTTMLKKLSLADIHQMDLNNRHPGWFISAGALINGYSAGMELRAGVRSVYAVFTPALLRSGTFYGGFGLGTSFSLSSNFSLNPVYTYSGISQKETYSGKSISAMPMNFGYTTPADYEYKTTIRHHQLKWIIQYALSKNVSVGFGPTFNQSTTRYYFPVEINSTDLIIISDPGMTSSGELKNNSTAFYYSSASARTNTVILTTEFINTWLGLEASFSYKINFFPRP